MQHVVIDDIRVRAVGKFINHGVSGGYKEYKAPEGGKHSRETIADVKTYWGDAHGWMDTAVRVLDDIAPGAVVCSPCIILNNTSTVLLPPGSSARITLRGDIMIDVGVENERALSTAMDSVQLAIFGHRFMSIAEQMGHTLQRTSISTNIKERLDFSCALFGPDGGLVANAPHLPVHLGAMQVCVYVCVCVCKCLVTYHICAYTHAHSHMMLRIFLTRLPCAGGRQVPAGGTRGRLAGRGRVGGQPPAGRGIAPARHHCDHAGVF
jgi:hypothetical protein